MSLGPTLLPVMPTKRKAVADPGTVTWVSVRTCQHRVDPSVGMYEN